MSNSTPARHTAKKSLGQNFLTEPIYIERIVRAVSPSSGDIVVEIGPGRGAITENLLNSGATVFAIELDDRLIAPLTERFGRYDNFHLLHQDALTVDFATALGDQRSARSIKLAANLPYYISTAILERLSDQREIFDGLVLMFQREVVDRITALPGSSDRGFLTVLTELAFDVEKLFDVPPNAFRPVPKVTSSVVTLTPKPQTLENEEEFRRLISTAFAQKRKTILNNLKLRYTDAHAALAASAIDPSRRAETLSLNEWMHLLSVINGRKL